MRVIILTAATMLAANSPSSPAHQNDGRISSMLAYRETSDGSLTILRNHPGPRCPPELFALYHVRPSEEIVHGCWEFAPKGHFRIYYGPGYRLQMIMRMQGFHAGPAYRGKFREMRD